MAEPAESDLRSVLRGCLGGLAWGTLHIAVGIAWLLASEQAVGWYLTACGADHLEPSAGMGLLIIMIPKLILFAGYSAGACSILVWVTRRWTSRSLGLVAALAGAALLTWGFWLWEINWVVRPSLENSSC
ncbi:hypothetical protein [Amycolatopsis sp. 3B14]|uniref:hypothetical protein n=1 Tax=Amycolatopsis sp. 3B14 TaxID=3243600 RepID=UPI003D956E69